jgi:hypothetical protein
VSRILSQALDGVPVEQTRRTGQPDLVIQTPDGRSVVIKTKWAGEGWPQDVRRAAADVPDPWPSNVVLLARQLSPGAIEWLAERGANWADEAGQARIVGPAGLMVIREPSRSRGREQVRRGFNWSPSAIAIAEVLLSSDDQPLRATQVAERSGWSVPQAANVLKAFDDQGWTVKRGAARGPSAYRQLVDPDALLTAWSNSAAARPRATRIAHRATRDVMGLLRVDVAPALDRTAAWAVSGWAALELAAPFATATPNLHIYVAEGDFAGTLSRAIEEAGLREVEEGGRVTFWAADPRVLALARRDTGVPVASPPRIYADLISFGARGLDAADHVKQQLIDPLHVQSRASVGDRQGADG